MASHHVLKMCLHPYIGYLTNSKNFIHIREPLAIHTPAGPPMFIYKQVLSSSYCNSTCITKIEFIYNFNPASEKYKVPDSTLILPWTIIVNWYYIQKTLFLSPKNVFARDWIQDKCYKVLCGRKLLRGGLFRRSNRFVYYWYSCNN